MSRTPENLISETQTALERVRAGAPLVQSITNAVVTNFTANALLALGAAPAMCDIVGEAGPFARIAQGLLINLGTPVPEQRAAALEAVTAANEAGTPWVLDPVAIGALPVRTALALRLRELRPTIVRGNASEILALAEAGAGGRGVDATDGVESAREAAIALARRTGAVIAVSGPTDLITDGERTVLLSNGDALLTRITGGGCALGAVMAAFAAGAEDYLVSTVAAVSTYTIAAELAAERASRPGSFQVAFLDALDEITPEHILARAVFA
ncbi:hydroxyethylthiazole kinase [Mycetocola tolaasinivorans]|uniref:Hydroxyethylthiazole kinase n=1 Tax=Mycetocola tolaasinivorans TaxID=76635 RepID=A0A3L7A288_9MICO|nr:hydroxyethylthiazole kinase [Mycetocola tolaasinivorans]RLP74118.1 hydroxyethylthiazole kinase [Mycetocola tolaasinivorans]